MEGELEPEPEPALENEPVAEDQGHAKLNHNEVESEPDDKTVPVKLNKDSGREKKLEVGPQDLVKKADDLPNRQSNSAQWNRCNEDVTKTTKDNGGSKEEERLKENNITFAMSNEVLEY
ncbi:hypothetical protein U1Q18_028084 [Sarracenia purpurea var. burkii]